MTDIQDSDADWLRAQRMSGWRDAVTLSEATTPTVGWEYALWPFGAVLIRLGFAAMVLMLLAFSLVTAACLFDNSNPPILPVFRLFVLCVNALLTAAAISLFVGMEKAYRAGRYLVSLAWWTALAVLIYVGFAWSGLVLGVLIDD